MDKYIKEYLLQYEKIQVNNLGVFETVYKSAEIHPILHTFTIPGKYVVFTENSITDTNELAIFIASKENISIDTANHHIAEWVNNLKNTIASKKEYPLSTMGKFFINAMGRIEFTPSFDIDISPDSFGLEEFTISPPSEPKSNQETNTDMSKTNTLESEDAEDDFLDEPIIGFGNKNIKKRSPGRTLLLVILFLLLCTALGIGITYFMYPEIVETYAEQLHLITCKHKINTATTEQIKETTVKDEETTQANDIPSPSTPTKDNTETSSEDKTTVTLPVEQNQINVPAGNYYVILGGFQSKENAQTFLKQKQKEYTNTVDLGKGQTSGLYLIGIGPYTKTEAENQIQNGIKGWILKK
ncbi:MAG: SPOR domain-containing protein [Bacteroidales bacterium]|jgi:nucleoid DNA-binding protein|nr:SPOR domain-containing protein [Bacteroidales bacterium]